MVHLLDWSISEKAAIFGVLSGQIRPNLVYENPTKIRSAHEDLTKERWSSFIMRSFCIL